MTTPSLAIRPGTAADAPGVVALIGRVFVEYGWIYDPPTEVADLLAFDAHYAAPHGAFWIVVDDGRVVGSVGVDRKGGPDVAELHRLYLDADQRGRGLGEALVGLVLDWCRAQAIARLELWSDTRFEHAHRLYLRLGFHRDGERTLAGDINDTREYRFERDV
jgi:RimJ/RimL family protein N-acetyltransferase